MNFESILSKPKKEPLDKQWFARFEKAGNLEAYSYFEGDKNFRAQQKEAFLKGEVENPAFDYPKIEVESMRDRLKELQQLKLDVKKLEANEAVKEAYRLRINEKKAEIRMLIAAKKGDLKNFQRMTEFVYGQPDKNVFAYTIRELKGFCAQAEQSGQAELVAAAQELLAVLPEAPASQTSYENPSPEVVERAKSLTQSEYAKLLEGLPIDFSKADTKPEEMAAVMQVALDKINAMVDPEQQWKVVLNPAGVSLNAEQQTRSIKVATKKTWPVETVAGLVAHELGTHVVRRMTGERSKLLLLSLGLDRYEGGEEGVAKMREQMVRGSFEEFEGLEAHLAISLATGADGKPRTFRQTFEIMEKVFAFTMTRDGKSAATVKEKARESAYNRCVRTFRGTDGQHAGYAFTKDMVYREGNIRVWDVIGKNPGEVMRFSVGKYDPSNEKHVWILDQLGITDEEDAQADTAI